MLWLIIQIYLIRFPSLQCVQKGIHCPQENPCLEVEITMNIMDIHTLISVSVFLNFDIALMEVLVFVLLEFLLKSMRTLRIHRLLVRGKEDLCQEWV